MNEVLGWYMYPKPNGTNYFEEEFRQSNKVIEIFSYCQILLAYITKTGWEFLIYYYGYEKLFEFNNQSAWIDCESLFEYKSMVKYYIRMSK